MNILLATEVIHPGGAETFVLRLSRALQQEGHKVHIFIFYDKQFNDKLYQSVASSVPLTIAKIPMPWLLSKMDSFLFKLNIDFSFSNFFIRRSLNNILQEEKTDIIHSHLLKTDNLCLAIANNHKIPVVTTIHGDYLQFYNNTQKHAPIPLLNYYEKAADNLNKLSHIVCISDKQISFFNDKFRPETSGKISKIYNGYNGVTTNDNNDGRAKLGISDNAFVFGMVSRGIPEKGWQVSIDAFEKLNAPDTYLLLVGDSPYVQDLKQKYASNKNIYFVGHSDKPLEWIKHMNVGLLPTTYASESLPTIIIEYLCCGIPSIASDAGEIVNMLKYGDEGAGIIVPIKEGSVSIDGVTNAMKKLLDDKQFYQIQKNNAVQCYARFDMGKCIDAYCAVYKNAMK
ncbi:MAG: glycosyltransferase family 4 protein [Bacteroidetes bacterium]|nr:glycosyltransferase family 4 protein [Bacteroidota bacterium]